MRNLACPQYSKCKRITAYVLLFIQFFSPLFLTMTSVVRASTQETASIDMQMLDTINGLNTLMAPSSHSSQLPSPQQPANAVAPPVLFDSSSVYASPNQTMLAPQPGLHNSPLPSLGGTDKQPDNQEDAQTRLAQGARQAGSLLSSDNSVDSSIGYARSIGESILNQEVNDWLNQLGKARVSFGSNSTGDADLLVPVFDNPNNILFTQVGIRANEDRTTTNAGVGYRQYQDEWMWGVNSFYDYDLTGSNARWGVGGELWADYVKLAANGYFRITDWHQSTLTSMRDYDERPANGFDIRAEGYLPSYPQLGAYAKYEQYFGEGVDLGTGTSPSDLKSDPSATTLGVSYTPIPLLTFKGQTSRGDSHDSNVAMEVTYRLGVPLSQQLDADKVDLMRSLAGNRYDFVDRNYNIVMQYRKQELLTISLPDSVDGEAAQTLPVVVTVHKAKYGLKSTAWTAPELIAAGGSIKVTSPTTVNLTLPAYVFNTRSNEPQAYRLYAVGTDGEGNPSNTAMTWVNVKQSQETITQLTVTSAMSPVRANNSDSYTAVALVQNEKQQVLANKEITFSVSGFKKNEDITLSDGSGNSGKTLTVMTDSNGQATITVKGKIAGQGSLKATMKNGNNRAESITFVADSTTAQVSRLELTKNKAVADGNATNVAVATVVDQFDNPVEAFALTSSASNGASVVTPSQTTNTEGQITVAFKSTAAGDSTLTVSGSGTLKTVVAQFVADISTATISSVVVDRDNAIANGVDTNALTVTVVDGNHNLLANAPVTITVPGTARYTTQPANGLTDSRGQLKVTVTSTKAGTEDYTAGINNSQGTQALTFKADRTTAQVRAVTLVGTEVNKVANGTNSFTYTVTVKDSNGNPVPDATVVPASDKTAVSTGISGLTDANGEATITLTSTIKAVADITVSAAVGTTPSVNADKAVSFIADIASAQVSSLTLVGTEVSQVANGTNSFTYTVTVKDSNGNRVPGATVVPASDKTDVVTTISGVTNANGEATITLTSTTKAVADITVSATVGATSVNADKTVSFIYNFATAQVSSVTLVGTEVSQVANGTNSFTYTVTVKDNNGNLVPGATVAPAADKIDVEVSISGETDANGEATITLTSTTKAVANITVSAKVGTGSVNADRAVSFIYDLASAQVSSVTLVGTEVSQVANGTNSFTYTVTVKDSNGNRVPGAVVTPAADKTDVVTRISGVTDVNGQATITLTSTTKAVADITVSAAVGATSGNADKAVNFIANSATAQVNSVTLVGTEVSKVANGTNSFTYTVTVKDNNGNLVPGATVTPASDKTDVVTRISGVTDINGEATITLTSTTKAVADITVSAAVGTRSANADRSVSFIYNLATAQVSSVTLVGSEVSKVANGTNSFTYTVTVKDDNGNRVPGAAVTPAADKTDVATTISGVTDINGEATITLTSTTKAVANITVSAAVGATSVNADKAVNFIANLASAQVSSVILMGSEVSKVANGTNSFTYTVTVKDSNGNLVPGATITPVADKTEVATRISGVTDANGEATITLTSTTKAVADITVSATVGTTSVNANRAVSFIADSASAEVSSVTLVGTEVSQVANGTNSFTYTVTVKDNNGNRVPGASIVPAADRSDVTVSVNGLTDAGGQATITLTSTTKAVADITVSATVGTTSVNADKTVSFIYNLATAEVSSVTLVGNEVSKVANGTNSFTYTVTVKDNNGNRVPGATVAPASDKTDVATTISGVTDANGEATITLTSTTKAVADITVSAAVGATSVNANKAVSFIYNLATAQVSSVTLVGTEVSKVANGTNSFTYTVMVKDSNGNRVPGAVVTPAADKTDVVTRISGVTDVNGQATITLTSTTKAVADITVSATVGTTSVNADKTVSFIANSATAQVSSVTLVGTEVSKVANGTNSFTYTVTVKDNNGNPVAGTAVTPASDKNDVATAISGVTDINGEATITLTSTTKAVANITVSATVGTTSVNADKAVSFIADIASAEVSSVILIGNEVSKVADGTNSFTYIVTVKDSNGNRVPGATVAPASDKTDVATTISGVTDANGEATITLTSSTKAVADITVSATVGVTGSVAADKTVSFTYDLATAQVDTVTLNDDTQSKVANGTNTFTYTVTVTDTNGNVIPNIAVTSSVDKDDVSLSANSITDASGQATITLTSTTTAVANITVSAVVGATEPIEADKTVSFTYDLTTAQVDTVTLNDDTQSKVANGTDSFTYTAQVVDGNGNPVTLAGITVTWAQDKGGDLSLPAISTTDANGQATITLTSGITEVVDITVSAKIGSMASVNADKTVSFIDTRPAIKEIITHVNSYTFSVDKKFPETGFSGAAFTLVLENTMASDYSWSSNVGSAITVTEGSEGAVVTFNNKPSNKNITITATPKNGGDNLTYSFSLQGWYVLGLPNIRWPNANAYCPDNGLGNLPTLQQLNGSSTYSKGSRGQLGGLWSEWGNLENYPGGTGGYHWSADQGSNVASYHYNVSLHNGEIVEGSNYVSHLVTCRQEF